MMATHENERASISEGTSTQLDPAVSGFVNTYLKQDRTVTAYVLKEDSERDQALISSMNSPDKPSYSELRQNCSTSCGDALRNSRVLESDQRPERGLLYDSPAKLKRSLDQGVLSGEVKAKVIFDPRNVTTVTPSQIKRFLGVDDQKGGSND